MTSPPLLTQSLIDRLRDRDAKSNLQRAMAIQHIDGNPFGADVQRFGGAIAVKFRSPALQGKNRVLNLADADREHLGDMLQFFRTDGLRCSFFIAALGITEGFAGQLARHDIYVVGSAGALYGAPQQKVASLPGYLEVNEIDQRDLPGFLELFLAANEVPDSEREQTREFERLENVQEGYRLFIAYIEGKAAAVGSMHVGDGIGSIVAGATLPEYRNRGCQTALLQRRLLEAHQSGCDLVVGNAAWFSTSQRNLERAGLRSVQFGLHARDCSPSP